MRAFEIPLEGERFQQLIREVEALARARGFDFLCLGLRGHFSGMGIRGEYHYLEEEELLVITVLEKPWLLPWSQVEAGIEQLFSRSTFR